MLTIRALEARHLTSGRPYKEAILQPHVTVKINDVEDQDQVMKTAGQVNQTQLDGFHPIWDHQFSPVVVHNPEVAVLHFFVHEVNDLAQSLIGQVAIPLSCCRPGLRSMMLRNEMDDEIPIAKLLIELTFETEEDINDSMRQCTEKIRVKIRAVDS